MKPGESIFLGRFSQGCERLGIEITDEGVSRLLVHFNLLEKWADRVNLTTVRDPEEMAELLYLDSAVLQKHLDPDTRLHDVGTGAGFPGLVVKALRPDLQVTLTEARRKKVSFLKQAAREMGLSEGLDIRHQRLGWEPRRTTDPENLRGPQRFSEYCAGHWVAAERTQGHRTNRGSGAVPVSAANGFGAAEPRREQEQWPEVVSRAAFPPREWVRHGAHLVAPGGRLWVCSGQPHGDDRDGLSRTLNVLDASLPKGFDRGPVHAYRLPFCGRKRLLVPLRHRPGS
jgi:hypothetical protein